VALRQLLALGLTERTVHSWAERGRLHRVHRGVYALSPVLTSKGRLMAAVLACGEGAALSHRSAAAHLGIRATSRALIEVSVLRGSARQRPGLQVHRQRSMETTLVDAIPCTTLAQTLLDLAEVVPPFHVRKAITRAEHLRIFDLTDVKRVANANGRKGAPILRSLLADFEPVTTESKLEDLFLPLCPVKPEAQYWINGYRADFAWPADKLIAEVDDWETHGTRTAFEKDRERLQELAAQGWRVVPFTYRQITTDPERVRTILRSLLLSAAA
jgi:very-short-patch-repair endonuclease